MLQIVCVCSSNRPSFGQFKMQSKRNDFANIIFVFIYLFVYFLALLISRWCRKNFQFDNNNNNNENALKCDDKTHLTPSEAFRRCFAKLLKEYPSDNCERIHSLAHSTMMYLFGVVWFDDLLAFLVDVHWQSNWDEQFSLKLNSIIKRTNDVEWCVKDDTKSLVVWL